MNPRAKQLPVSWRLASWLVILAWIVASPALAAEFTRVNNDLGYVRVGGSENNVYVVGPVTNALLIDGHYDSSGKETIAALENAGIRAGHVRALVITHAHDDHFGGAGALARWSHAPIWAHVATATEIEDPWGGFARPGGVFPNTTMADWSNYVWRVGAPGRVERILREGDVIHHEGLTLEVLHTPGHDRSEIALCERQRRWIFCGDLIQRGGPGWMGLFTDVASQRKSLRRVRDLKLEWCFGGHGNPVSGVATVQDQLGAALDWLDTLEKSLLDILREKSPRRTIDVTRAAWRKIYERAGSKDAGAGEARDPRPYSVISVDAMLLDLSRRGLVKRTSDWAWELAQPAAP